MSDRFDLIELPSAGAATIQLDGSKANIYAGGQGAQGDIALRDEQGRQSVHIDGGGGNLTLGGGGHEGDIALQDTEGNQSVHIDGGGGNLTLGGGGHEGDIALQDTEGKQTIHVDGGDANLTMGGEGHNADIRLLDASGKLTIHLDGGTGEVLLGGKSLQPADFVFAADYPLPSLGDLRSFIRRNGHLPSLRPGREMEEAGVNLGEFVMKLLQKVEELTLYVIKQEDVIQQQQRRVEQVEKRMHP